MNSEAFCTSVIPPERENMKPNERVLECFFCLLGQSGIVTRVPPKSSEMDFKISAVGLLYMQNYIKLFLCNLSTRTWSTILLTSMLLVYWCILFSFSQLSQVQNIFSSQTRFRLFTFLAKQSWSFRNSFQTSAREKETQLKQQKEKHREEETQRQIYMKSFSASFRSFSQ